MFKKCNCFLCDMTCVPERTGITDQYKVTCINCDLVVMVDIREIPESYCKPIPKQTPVKKESNECCCTSCIKAPPLSRKEEKEEPQKPPLPDFFDPDFEFFPT